MTQHRRGAGRPRPPARTSSRRCPGTSTTGSSRPGPGRLGAGRADRVGLDHPGPPVPDRQALIPRRAVAFGGFSALAGARRPRAAAASTACSPCRRRSRSGLTGWGMAVARGGPAGVQHPGRVPRRRHRARGDHRPSGVIAGRPVAGAASATGGPTPSPCSPTTCATTSPPSSPAGRAGQGPGDPELRRHRGHPARSTGRRPTARELGIGDETVVMYAGNVGFSQSLELLLAAAAS